MFDHVVFGLCDYAAIKASYLKALESLGRIVAVVGPLGVELSPEGGKSSLCRFQTEEKPARLHLAFTA
jgi:hypothetical protein